MALKRGPEPKTVYVDVLEAVNASLHISFPKSFFHFYREIVLPLSKPGTQRTAEKLPNNVSVLYS